MEMRAAQVPLVELLRAVPKTERIFIDEGNYTTHHIPAGKHCPYCHDAADLIDSKEKEIQVLKVLLNKPVSKMEITDDTAQLIDKYKHLITGGNYEDTESF